MFGVMSPRARVFGLVAAAAVGAAVAVVAIVAATSPDSEGRDERVRLPRGAPPLALDLGVRTDGEAAALRRAADLYARGERRSAATVFDRHRSLEAQVGSALARWPEQTLARLELLGQENGRRAVVQLHLGLVRLWSGRPGAADALRAAARLGPDTRYALVAENFLHPDFAPGVPVFVPAADVPPAVAELPAHEQLRALARQARTGGAREKLLYGVALQRLGRQRSAQRQYDAALAAAPEVPEAHVAAAVVRFEKARPARAFSRLGPLTRRFPRAATVRFHVGLLLLWSGDVDEGRRQLRLARSLEPRSRIAAQAGRFLRELARVRPSGRK